MVRSKEAEAANMMSKKSNTFLTGSKENQRRVCLEIAT